MRGGLFDLAKLGFILLFQKPEDGILLKELECKVKTHNVEGYTAEDKKIQTSSM